MREGFFRGRIFSSARKRESSILDRVDKSKKKEKEQEQEKHSEDENKNNEDNILVYRSDKASINPSQKKNIPRKHTEEPLGVAKEYEDDGRRKRVGSRRAVEESNSWDSYITRKSQTDFYRTKKLQEEKRRRKEQK